MDNTATGAVAWPELDARLYRADDVDALLDQIRAAVQAERERMDSNERCPAGVCRVCDDYRSAARVRLDYLLASGRE